MPGAYTAPLYPALVAAVAGFDPTLRAAAACVRHASDEGIADCPADLGWLPKLQFALAALTLALVWRTALAVTDSPLAAGLALPAAGLLTSEYATYARSAMTEALALPLAAAFGLCLVLVVRIRRPSHTIAAGVLLGLLALTRPDFFLIAWALLPVAALLALAGRRDPTLPPLALHLVAIAGVAAAVTAPWLIRNRILFGEAGITVGYGGFILAQRLAYDAMTGREWLASWIYSLPAFGPKLARDLFPPAWYVRLGWEERPDTFYSVGQGLITNRMWAAVPDPSRQVAWLARNYVLPDLPKFLAATVVMAWKGLWIRKFFSLVTVPFLFAFSVRALRRLDAPALALLLPPVFILWLHAAVTVGTPRYSLVMIPADATAFAFYLALWLAPILRRLPHRDPAHPVAGRAA